MKILMKNTILVLSICILLSSVFAEASSRTPEPPPLHEKFTFEEVKARIPLHRSKFRIQVPEGFNRQAPKLMRISNERIALILQD